MAVMLARPGPCASALGRSFASLLAHNESRPAFPGVLAVSYDAAFCLAVSPSCHTVELVLTGDRGTYPSYRRVTGLHDHQPSTGMASPTLSEWMWLLCANTRSRRSFSDRNSKQIRQGPFTVIAYCPSRSSPRNWFGRSPSHTLRLAALRMIGSRLQHPTAGGT